MFFLAQKKHRLNTQSLVAMLNPLHQKCTSEIVTKLKKIPSFSMTAKESCPGVVSFICERLRRLTTAQKPTSHQLSERLHDSLNSQTMTFLILEHASALACKHVAKCFVTAINSKHLIACSCGSATRFGRQKTPPSSSKAPL